MPIFRYGVLMSYPVYHMARVPKDLPEGKFGVGYPFIHNVYVKRGDSINFSYHHVKKLKWIIINITKRMC